MDDLKPSPVEIPDDDRRRSPRFSCGGQAQILCLPSEGLLFNGQICNISLGGCYIEPAKPLVCNDLAEILLRINKASFRAVGQVKGVHGSGVGVEFIRFGARGRELLEELIRRLAKLKAEADAAALLAAQEAARKKALQEAALQRALDCSSRSRLVLPDFSLHENIEKDLRPQAVSPEKQEKQAETPHVITPGKVVLDIEIADDDPVDFFI